MARPRSFDEDVVSVKLQDVFWEKGFEGASYADIMAATGLQKGSLYAAFGDKRALYQLALKTYDKGQVSPGVAMLTNSDVPARDRIGLLMDGVVNAAGTRRGRWGCLLCNAAVDQAPFDVDAEKAVKASMSRMKKAIAKCVEGTPAQGAADLIWSAYFGGRVVVKAGYPKKDLAAQKAQILALFD